MSTDLGGTVTTAADLPDVESPSVHRIASQLARRLTNRYDYAITYPVAFVNLAEGTRRVRWLWLYRVRNGNVMARGPEHGYVHRVDAVRGAHQVVGNGATVLVLHLNGVVAHHPI